MDRRLMKWQGFIMPEHKAMIKNAEIESLKATKPILDEGQLQEINDLLVMSMQDEEKIELSLWLDGFIEDFGPVIIHKIDPYQRKLYVRYKDGQQVLHFDSLIGTKKI
jgi:hypothetical protein